jgi:hypothetical protein
MISPVFMVSGCALLLSTSNNKYSSVASRIRILINDEKSKINKTQIKLLVNRLQFIRNATYCFQLAIGFFVLSSLNIGVSYFLKNNIIDKSVMILFSFGMMSVFSGVFFLMRESNCGFKIIKEYIKYD